MQIQYELLKTTLKRIFESYKWNSGQIKKFLENLSLQNKVNKKKWWVIFASDTQIKIMSSVIYELLNTYLALIVGCIMKWKKNRKKNMGELLTRWI